MDVEDGRPPFGNTRRLTTSCDVKDDPQRAHGVVLPGGSSPKGADGKLLHEEVWKYLFTHPVTETGTALERDPGKVRIPPGR